MGSFVKLPKNPGLVNFSFLTGAGRDIGDETAIIRRVVLTDSFGTAESKLLGDYALQLNGYTHNIIPLVTSTTSSRFFTSYTLEIKELHVDNGTSFPDVFPANSTAPLVQVDFPTSIRTLPGRETAVQIRLDDTMFDVTADPIFQQSIFEASNLADNPVQGIPTLNGFLSDYVAFDLTNMAAADRPTMSDSTPAGFVYFSGDFSALSVGGTSGNFEVLTTLGFIGGTFSPVVNLPGPDSTKPPFGTYTLNQADPRDIDPSDNTFPGDTVHQITALQGSYYALSDVVGNMGSFEMITFPRSQERMVHDTQTNTDVLRELSVQDVVLIKRNGTAITEMYFGEIDFGQNQGDPTTLRAYPINQIDDGDAHNEIVGTVSAFKDVNGNAVSLNVADSQRADTIQKIGSGTFTLANSPDPVYGGTVPADFPTTGRFLVFRR